jgi:nitroimidazol reductase NimA-like FMN-containing flavoprotein (pyridoxamine 5'-phosphate oxidase superfamily)
LNKILFVDFNSTAEARECLELMARVAGPAWTVDCADLRADDLRDVSLLAVGGDLSGLGVNALLPALVRIKEAAAAIPCVIYASLSQRVSVITDFESAFFRELGKKPSLTLDASNAPIEAGMALRALRDSLIVGRLGEDELRARIDAFLLAHKTCALATGSNGRPRVTPIEYLWKEGKFLFFSEGGEKFAGLSDGAPVSLCLYEEYSSFSKVKGLQVTGRARLLPNGSPEWAAAFSGRGINPEKLAAQRLWLNVFCVEPERMELLDAKLGSSGFNSRQILDFT